MNDQDITKLAAKLVETVASKDDIKEIKEDIKRLENRVVGLEFKSGGLDDKVEAQGDRFTILGRNMQKVATKVEEIDEKANTILKFARATNGIADNHEKRLKNIERIPVVAHELRKN